MNILIGEKNAKKTRSYIYMWWYLKNNWYFKCECGAIFREGKMRCPSCGKKVM